MSYLLDACVLSDTVAKQPNPGVREWLLETDPWLTYLIAPFTRVASYPGRNCPDPDPKP